MKLRFVAMGCIISVLGAVLILARGYSPALLGLFLVGIVLLVVGLLWPKAEGQGVDGKNPE